MKLLVTTALILRVVDYGESDRVVTLLGRETGKLSALARGARKSQKRFAGGLGLGMAGEASLRERPGSELLGLERFEGRRAASGLSADVGRMAHAGYVLELVTKLCPPRQAEPRVFDLLDVMLLRLEEQGASAERLRVFELGLLGRVGLAPVLDSCVACGRTDLGSEETRWSPERGGTVCRGCGRTGRPMRASVRAALARLAATPIEEVELERLAKDINVACREAILELVRLHVAGPLRSVEFITKLAQGGSTP